MRKVLAATAMSAGVLLGLPTAAFAFNPQPDPPRVVSIDLSVASITVQAQLCLYPPGPTRTGLTAALPPGPCRTAPVTG